MLFFKKKKVEPTQKPTEERDVMTMSMKTTVDTISYPSIVEEIHNEFFTASDRILEEAKRILNECNTKDLDKGKRLAALGFERTPQALNARMLTAKIYINQNIAELIKTYQEKYPFNKFITESQVEEICEKYSLIFGNIGLYQGFVPEKSLNQVEKFKLKPEDNSLIELVNTCVKKVSLGYYDKKEIPDLTYYIASGKIDDHYPNHSVLNEIKQRAIEAGIQEGHIYVQKSNNPVGLKICAPMKDMDTRGMELNGYKLQEHIPDPVVLQPVKGGYLIVTAWGDEASDPIVVNEINN